MADPHADFPTCPHGIPCYMTHAELDMLADCARQVPAGGLILEVGACYGGSTVTMALAAPEAIVVSVDFFIWSPLPTMPASAAQMHANLKAAGVENVAVMDADSHHIGRLWSHPVDEEHVDGTHEPQDVRIDLENFGPHAAVVCAHDFGNPSWDGVEPVVREFCAAEGFAVAEQADYLAVLRRNA